MSETSHVAGKIRSRVTLHQEVVAAIREMIVDGQLEPGQKVPEASLCETLQVSRTPLREALKVLAAEGMLELLPQRGARVATVTEQEVEELFPILASMEALAAELACVSMTDGQFAEIEALHHEMISAYQKRDRQEYARLNRAIHFSIFRAAGNASLLALYQTLELKIRNIRHTARKNSRNWQTAIDDHEKILESLQKRDVRLASAVMRQHIMNTARSVQASLKELPELSSAS
ncbi:GntR family transcriptional regulator [Agrobacterium tumefaciens]|uniref:GntR family transcriptional regulator n=1 Tax=Agrobacterium tumefaciens TaxID=358 RepID=UPI0021D202E0|nr:GntR family transcriptional regulator [Agrobacterium tumefaciens]UXS05455.1 GntR family transcriptional regulator [Agrobacterium tumefaciens]